ncbi:Outer membrane protein beta-barrel family protein [Mucilaginibacter mallensis]|uniref:Outer membrane protein beta-barrel family protein n=1 Tax=Mucilaginibacter mallensis TaxID=652787 RepID=A0A1H2B2G0_MUCMA|nr:outer membrane beta-barrel protein [Mucilaginibacter mallensis]SDT52237.1 Outer membrane protein beta-barrel family protein [Mucilaginibacter mallensis]
MRNRLILFCLLIFTGFCNAQTKHFVSAKVVDSIDHHPVELATIALIRVRDSSLISYTITDTQGAFILRNVRDDEPLRILITHVGYVALHINLNFTKTLVLDLGRLSLNQKTMDEVTVKGQIVPIIVKKDTIEFDAEAFKVRPNAVVQDLLKKFPGVQVDRDGTITVNGKAVSKVKVDGRDFFANDPKIATQNLDADMISKVQIYDDRENDPDHLLPDYKVEKIINLKFKKKFSKATFGKLTLAVGTQDRYNLDGLYNQSLDNLQVTVISNSNNLGNTQFVGTSLDNFGTSQGINRVTGTGININDNFGKKVKLNLVYNFDNTAINNLQTSNVAQLLNDTTVTHNATNNIHSSNYDHAINGNLQIDLDSASYIKYTPILRFSTGSDSEIGRIATFNNYTPLLSISNNQDNSNNSNIEYQHSIIYYHAYKKKGESLTITNTLNINPSHSKSINNDQLIAYTAGLISDTLNRLANTSNRNSSASLSAGYHYPISKTLTADFLLKGSYLQNGANLLTYNIDPKTGTYDVFLTEQSSMQSREQWTQSGRPQLVYHKKDFSLTVGLVAQFQQIENSFNDNSTRLFQNFAYLLPSASIVFKKFNFDYSEAIQQPSIDQLRPIVLVYNQLNSVEGNPNLRPSHTHNFSINYSGFDVSSNAFINLSAQFSLDNNSIVLQDFINAQGAQLTTYINKNGSFTANINGNFSKSFKQIGDWQIRETTNVNAKTSHNFFETNGQQGFQTTYTFPVKQQFFVSWKDVIEFEPTYVLSPTITHYESVNFPSQHYLQQMISLPLDVIWPKHINWSLNYTHFYNSLEAEGFQRQSNLVSLSFARSIQKKEKGEIRFTCYDLFKQSVSSSHFVSNNTIFDSQNQVVKQYFMLTYTYRFDKTE